MKPIFAVALMFAAVAAFAQEPEAKFRTAKLVNADFAIPSDEEVIGWEFQSRDFAGTAEIVTEDGVNVVKITPTKAVSGDKRAIYQNTGVIHAQVGDTVKYEVTFKGEPGAQLGLILYNGVSNQWVVWQRPCRGPWQTVTQEYVIKAKNPKADAEKKYYFAADVFYKPVMLKSIKVSVKKAGAAK